jgi:hypothetical protein
MGERGDYLWVVISEQASPGVVEREDAVLRPGSGEE